MNSSATKRSPGDWLRVAGTVLALGLLIYLIGRQGWDQILRSIRQITLARFLLVLGLTFVSRLVISGRWASLLLLSGVRMPLTWILRVNYAGLFASNFLPTSIGGDIVRLAGAVQLKSDRARYISSIAVDRLIGLVGMAVLWPVGASIALSGQGAGRLPGIGAHAQLLTVAAGSSRLRDLWNRGVRALHESLELVRAWLSSPKALSVALACTWLHMLIKFSAMRLLFDALHESLSVWHIAGLWSLVYFIALFPVSINSLGLMEVSTGIIFSSVGGVAVSSALTVALLIRTAEILASLPGALSLPGLLPLRRPLPTQEGQG